MSTIHKFMHISGVVIGRPYARLFSDPAQDEGLCDSLRPWDFGSHHINMNMVALAGHDLFMVLEDKEWKHLKIFMVRSFFWAMLQAQVIYMKRPSLSLPDRIIPWPVGKLSPGSLLLW